GHATFIQEAGHGIIIGGQGCDGLAPLHGSDLLRGNLHGRLKLASNSSAVTVAVPTFPTTTPAAWLEKMAASTGEAPAAIARVNEAMTVSPAPDTSTTS